MERRKFLSRSTLTSLAVAMGILETENIMAKTAHKIDKPLVKPDPIAICTWQFTKANFTAGTALEEGKSALDAAILGVAIEEENIKNTTVGKGGAPDREGNVTLDACVMDQHGNCGSVVCVENITNVAALAKEVMLQTPHVMLAAKGAEEFAYSIGFEKEELLTQASKEAWQNWLKTSNYKPIINIENHDTIGMLTIDKNGDLSGACTTSGLSYKMKGRVGDSPIIGSGLFVDNEIGGAAATGMGEEVIKTVGSFLIVELMRNGMSPQEACEEAINRIVKKNKGYQDFQIAYIAINKNGETGAYCIHPGFTMMKYQNAENQNIQVKSYLE